MGLLFVLTHVLLSRVEYPWDWGQMMFVKVLFFSLGRFPSLPQLLPKTDRGHNEGMQKRKRIVPQLSWLIRQPSVKHVENKALDRALGQWCSCCALYRIIGLLCSAGSVSPQQKDNFRDRDWNNVTETVTSRLEKVWFWGYYSLKRNCLKCLR